MECDRSTIVSRIQKLYALAGNNPNEAEAAAAMLKAQALLLEHGVSTAEVEVFVDSELDTVENPSVDTEGTKLAPWQIAVANIIAKNFRCRMLISSRLYKWNRSYYGRSSYRKYFMIVGMSKDADVACVTIQFALRVIPQLWKKYWNDRGDSGWCERNEVNRIKDSYMYGFTQGLKDQFAAQVATKALAIVVPQAVMERTAELSGGTHHSRGLGRYDSDATNSGYRDGQNFGAPHKFLPV